MADVSVGTGMDAQHLLDLRLKRHISEYRFMECQLEEMAFAMEAFGDAFRDEFRTDIASAASRRLAVENADACRLQADATEEVHDLDPLPVHNAAKGGASRFVRKLYHKLAVVLHPDKTGGSTAAFLAVEEAYREQNPLKLLMIAHDAHIPMNGLYTQEDDVSGSITLIKNKIAKIRASVAWAWYDAAEADRPQLRRSIVETLGRFRP